MSEGIYNSVQLGKQSSLGTAVAATTVFPVDTGWTGFVLDRAMESPDEDFGSTSREQTGRGSTGVRWATAQLPFVARFEDLAYLLEMHVVTIGTPTGTASPYTWAYTFDETANALSTALKPYTMEYGVLGSTQDEWQAKGVIVDKLDLGFTALTAPGNVMWKGTADLVAVDRAISSMTTSQSAPATLETMEGHLTTLSEGPVGTAFASLAALSGSLRQFGFSSTNSAVGRVYGGSTDTATAIGRSAKGDVTFTALVGISSTSKTDIHDIFNVSGALPTERRWRIACSGSGTKSMTIDFRARFKTVDLGIDNGEHLYSVQGVWVKDATLGGRGTITIKNGVSALP